MAQASAPPTQPQPKASAAAIKPQKRVRTPTIVQMETTESGAVALAIVLGAYGLFLEQDVLRKACGAGRDGAAPENVVKAATSFGMEAALHDDINTARLLTLPTPLIALTEGGQYVVVEGYNEKSVFVNNPASGAKTYTHRDFKSAFDDLAITLAPGPNFKKGGKAPSNLAALTERLRGSRISLAFVLLASIGLILPTLLTPLFTQVFIDQFLSSQINNNMLLLLLVGMLITAVLRGALTWLQTQYLLRLQTKLAVRMSAEFFWHVLRLPIDFFTQRYRGEIGSRINLNDMVAAVISQELTMAVISIIMAIFYLALMLFYDVVLTLVVLTFGLMNILILRFISRMISDSNKRLLQQSGKLQGVSMNGIQTIETLKATGRESDFFARWTGLQANVYNAQQGLQVPIQILNAVPTLLSSLSVALILVLGGLRIMNGDFTVGMLVAFQSLAISFLAPMGDLLDLGSTYQQATSAVLRLDDMLKTPADPLLPAAATSAAALADIAPKLAGRLELRDITFGYDPLGAPLIEKLNLTLEPGSRVALIGGTGSGKSTIANLVVGLYVPWSGDILFDGAPRSAVPHQVMTNSLAKVDQSIFLFEGTVRDNLTLWDPTVPQQHVLQAARDASIHDTISARTGAYESIVAEGGANFSGGQAQRLEIARSLVFNPSILILDEATSALDPPTEAEIDKNLRRRGCTCLIVAHRLSTIRDCDEIIVLEHGKVVQRGTHDEMYQVAGPYRQLIQAQTATDASPGDSDADANADAAAEAAAAAAEAAAKAAATANTVVKTDAGADDETAVAPAEQGRDA
jgi:NHLM bacteriocin system ABC transporter peptidase/ATP-binding protein